MPDLRRSERLGTYDSNGRDYLSSGLGWTRSKFEEWTYSTAVRSHLQEWYIICIVNRSRFNDAVEWINTGAKGYFYNESDLEEDLLFMCLCAGDDGHTDDYGQESSINFQKDDTNTGGWITQELWARTAWRVVHANQSGGQIFYHAMKDRPAAAYGFAVEMLCIIFHSIAFRRADSVYMPLVKGGEARLVKSDEQMVTTEEAIATKHSEDNGALDDMSSSSSNDADRTSDTTFTNHKKRKRAVSELSTIILVGNAEPRPEKEEDIGSTSEVKSREVAIASAPSSVITADKSPLNGEGELEPLTPDTSMTLREMVVFDEGEISKDERVREWLKSTEAGRSKPRAYR